MQNRKYSILVWFLILTFALKVHTSYADEPGKFQIKSIQIIVHDVFDTNLPKEDGAFYKAVNKLHLKTRKSTIETQLEFKEGDWVSQAKIDETARVLRANRYIRDANIEQHTVDGEIELIIHVYDTWSTKPKVNYSNKGGAVDYELGLREENFLGRGIGLGLSFRKDLDRSYSILKLSKDHVFGGDLRLDTQYADTDDGFIKDFAISKPYRYFENTSAYGVSLNYQELAQSLYFQGESFFDFSQLKRETELFYSLNHIANNISYKSFFGWHRSEISHEEMLEAPSISNPILAEFAQSQNFLPTDTNLSYPYYKLSVLENLYTQRRFFDGIGSTEDHHLGWDAEFKVGYIYDAGDSAPQQTYLAASGTYARETSRKGLALAKFSTKLRTDGKHVNNAVSDLNFKYYLPQTPHFLLFGEYQLLSAHKLDGGQQLLLGEEGGTRGYPVRFISADHIGRFTLEQRYYNHNQVWRVFNFGCALFVDFIHASGGNELEKEFNNHFQTVGFGFRIANNRSSISDIIHIDFSKPINPPEGVDGFQINVSSQKHF